MSGHRDSGFYLLFLDVLNDRIGRVIGLAHAAFSFGGISSRTGKRFRRAVPLLVLAGCSGPLSALEPASRASASIATLWWVMLCGAAVVFVLVMGLLFLTLLRPGFGSRFSPGGWILAGGLGLPVPVLTVLVGYSLYQGEGLLQGPDTHAPVRVEVSARTWSWEFAYPEVSDARSTTDVLHIPAGRAVEAVVTSSDVIHSFWIPRLGGKIDAIPGHETVTRLRADRPGLYRGVCSEFCGTGHAGMWFHVEAHPAEAYERAVRAAGQSGGGG
jgi:cytochrome c oxidase subunit II